MQRGRTVVPAPLDTGSSAVCTSLPLHGFPPAPSETNTVQSYVYFTNLCAPQPKWTPFSPPTRPNYYRLYFQFDTDTQTNPVFSVQSKTPGRGVTFKFPALPRHPPKIQPH